MTVDGGHDERSAGDALSRRRFIGRAAVAGAAVAGAGVVGWRLRQGPERWDAEAYPPPGDARVAVVRASYERGLEDVVVDGLREIGADVHGARVLLKPNLVEFDEGTAVNTDPRLVVAAVAAFRRLGATDVTVGEGPGHRRDTQYVVEASGLGTVLRQAGAAFVDLNLDAVAPVRLRTHYTDLEELWLPRSVVDADVVVSMPKMKTHHWAGVTLSLKNCFGCVPGRVYGWPKNALHLAGLYGSILDVSSAVRPDLAIVDGIVGMEGNGPINGTPKDMGVVVVGDDPVATDVTASMLMGVDPESVVYLAEAARFLGQGDPDRILAVGETVESLAQPFVPAPRIGDDASS
jgi:uncharacterized protein (DUF362 family)